MDASITSQKIYIVDNFLSENDLKSIKSIINNKKWDYGQSSNGSNKTIKFWMMDLMDENFIKDNITNKIIEEFSSKFTVERLYANGQTYGQNGSFHQDVADDCGDYFTFCLYINSFKDEIIEEIDGFFFIKIPEEKYSLSVAPLNNRGILFPSHYYHKGNAFNNAEYGMRVSIAWKLKKI